MMNTRRDYLASAGGAPLQDAASSGLGDALDSVILLMRPTLDSLTSNWVRQLEPLTT